MARRRPLACYHLLASIGNEREGAERLATLRQRKATEAYLHAHGIEVAPEILDRMVRTAVERLAETVRGPTREELTRAEASVLEDGSFDLSARELGSKDPVAQAAAVHAALLETGLTTRQAAETLDVHPSRIRQRLRDRTLYGIRADSRWRIPTFQFEGDRLVPGAGEVFSEIDPDLHPAAVYRWFTSSSPDLHDEEHDEDLSPRQWLVTGRPVEPVVQLARDL